MISAETGGRPKVIGSSIAIVAIGPMPGSTPTAVPRNTPIRQYMQVRQAHRRLEAKRKVGEDVHR